MISLTVNGEQYQLENVDPQTPLLWVLRDHLNMVGTKFGCGQGLCGACTVHLNGEPIRSCGLPISAADGQQIMTIEGLAKQDATGVVQFHPLQQAWIEVDVPQGGRSIVL